MARLRSKFETTYDNLFEGRPIAQVANVEPSQFWSDLFSLQVNSPWLSAKLDAMSKEDYLNEQKSFFGMIFSEALNFYVDSPFDDTRKANALETLVVILRSTLQKDLAGWEIMDLLASNVSESDRVFGKLVEGIELALESTESSANMKHRTLQLALVFACGIGQLSPGAYLLRRDLFPVIILLVKNPETTQYTFEAVLLLSILANYHKQEAANLNPYLKRIRGTVDHTFLNKTCWAVGFAFETATKAYQEVQDDTPPTFVSTVGSFLTSLRPDKVLSSTVPETPKEAFRDQPIEAAVVLLPLYEIMQLNQVFPSVVIESLSTEAPSNRAPMICSFFSFASYLFSHASSVGTPRCLAYANLAMRICVLISQDDSVTSKLSRETGLVRICRQRLPRLPESSSSRPLLCSFLDCCVLWLRHNLHKKLEISTYRLCILTVHSLLWTLSRQRIRLEYHWEELWKNIFVLLEFMSSRLDNVKVLGRVEELVEEALVMLEFACLVIERIMPTPEALHQFVYEVVRSKPVIDKQLDILTALEVPIQSAMADNPRGTTLSIHSQAIRAIKTIQGIATYYETKIGGGMETGDVMKTIATEIEKEGVHLDAIREAETAPRRSDSSADVSFVRWACTDGLSLLS